MTKLDKFIASATPSNISKLDDELLTKLNKNLHLANTLSTMENRKKIKSIQNIVHHEMYGRGFDVIKPKN